MVPQVVGVRRRGETAVGHQSGIRIVAGQVWSPTRSGRSVSLAVRYAERLMQMTYTEVAAPPDLAAWVAAFWSFEVDAAAGEIMHTIPVTGGAMLSASHGELFLVGPRTAPLIVPVHGGELYRGVHLLPGASTALFGISAETWRDVQMPARLAIEPAWCDRLVDNHATDEAFIAAATDAIRDLAAKATPADRVVTGAVVRLLHSNGNEPIADLARAAGLSPRQFRRRFAHAVGLTPKELARVIRIRAAAAAAVTREESWVDIGADHGFADQAHLVREFRSILGATPTRFGAHARRIAHRGKSFE